MEQTRRARTDRPTGTACRTAVPSSSAAFFSVHHRWLFGRSALGLFSSGCRGVLLPMLAAGLLGLAQVTAPLSAPAAHRPAMTSARSYRVLQYYRSLHQQAYAHFVDELEKLARQCESQGLTDAARQVRSQIVPFQPDQFDLSPLPEQVQPRLDPDTLPPDQRWRARLQAIKANYAKDLYLLSRRVLRAGFPSYAYALVRQVARFDPDHAAARRLLGYERYGDRWVTPFTAYMLRRHYVWHDRFGWLPESHVERYERGERYYRGWMDAAKEAEIRHDFRHAWEVRTEHYLVKTNHSLEGGVELAKALEYFYDYFRQAFVAFFNTPQQLQRLFEGRVSSRSRRTLPRPHVVYFFRAKSEYVTRLQDRIPQIQITNGLYLPEDRIVYTFFNPDPQANMRATLFHEATHQLLYESLPRPRALPVDANFWAIEGIACYMESAELGPKGIVRVGDPGYIRFQTARYHYVENGFYIPMARFTAMSKDEIQNHPKISRLYAQAAGLAYFFLHYDGGRYRDAFIQHLSQIYGMAPLPRGGHVQSLAELTGVSFEELDRQYDQFMRSLPNTLPPGAVIVD